MRGHAGGDSRRRAPISLVSGWKAVQAIVESPVVACTGLEHADVGGRAVLPPSPARRGQGVAGRGRDRVAQRPRHHTLHVDLGAALQRVAGQEKLWYAYYFFAYDSRRRAAIATWSRRVDVVRRSQESTNSGRAGSDGLVTVW